MFFSLLINTMKIIISIFFIQFLFSESNLNNNPNSTESLISDLKEIAVNVIIRGDEKLLPPFEDVEILKHDKIVLELTKDQLTEKLKSKIFQQNL